MRGSRAAYGAVIPFVVLTTALTAAKPSALRAANADLRKRRAELRSSLRRSSLRCRTPFPSGCFAVMRSIEPQM
jgi:hypothetical protein